MRPHAACRSAQSPHPRHDARGDLRSARSDRRPPAASPDRHRAKPRPERRRCAQRRQRAHLGWSEGRSPSVGLKACSKRAGTLDQAQPRQRATTSDTCSSTARSLLRSERPGPSRSQSSSCPPIRHVSFSRPAAALVAGPGPDLELVETPRVQCSSKRETREQREQSAERSHTRVQSTAAASHLSRACGYVRHDAEHPPERPPPPCVHDSRSSSPATCPSR